MAQKLRANEHNNSQYCSPDNIGSCCDSVGEWCANNSRHCWDLQCIVGRILPIRLWRPCVMRVRGSNNVGRAVQTDPTLLRFASAITEQKKSWELLAQNFEPFQTLRNNTQQHATTSNMACKRTQHVTSSNVVGCWPAMLHLFARGMIHKKPPCIFPCVNDLFSISQTWRACSQVIFRYPAETVLTRQFLCDQSVIACLVSLPSRLTDCS